MSKVSEAAKGEAAKGEAQGEAPAAEKVEVQIPKGYIEDSQERLVPIRRVKPADLERDRLVKDLVEEADRIHAQLAAFRDRSMDAVDAFVEKAAREYGTSMAEGKGNVTLASYDGRLRVQIQVTEYLQFDEKLEVARKLIGDCLKRWGRNADTKIKAVVREALRVDKRGQVDTKRILGLRKLDMDGDEQWEEAMRALSDSVSVGRSKRYVRVQRRTERGSYETVTLSLAAL